MRKLTKEQKELLSGKIADLLPNFQNGKLEVVQSLREIVLMNDADLVNILAAQKAVLKAKLSEVVEQAEEQAKRARQRIKELE